MRKLFAVASTIAMLAVFALPVHAASGPCAPPPPPGTMPAKTYTCTMHLTNFTPPPMPVTPIVCPDGSQVPGGVLSITIQNGVFHVTINTAGDLWDTSTVEGPFTFVSDAGVTYSGHYTQWFGDSLNNKNAVSHGTLNFVGTSGTSMLNLHLLIHFSISASGNPNVFMKTNC
jgi:hypothetical protein